MNYAQARSLAPDEIPVIDVGPLFDGGAAGLRHVAEAIRVAATGSGFFYIANHGVPREVMETAYTVSQRFFALPDEEKLKVAVNARHRGFIKVGEAKMHSRARPDLKESFIFGLDLPEDDPDVRAGKKLMGPNQWPPALPEMQVALDRYFAAATQCGRNLLRAIAVALELEETFFVPFFRKPLARGALVYYPPQPPQLGAEQFGVAPHSDYGCITLVSQDMNGGLQIRSRAGEWIAATPIADTFVVNIGDLLARWTNDRFVSTPHRVVNTSGRARCSIAMFFDPHYDTPIEVLPSCVKPGEAPLYPPTTCGNYVRARFDAAFAYRKA
ncbi:MAG: isopenicillin N synthase family oxygenase [Proteobacteria bacterium]|nr:isopenicillin N synthase family oxygenase [Pseudomonadota bacterium]